MSELRPGDMIDAYRVDALIGRGASGAVYRVRHVSLGRPMALKLWERKDARARLEREARMASLLAHENAVPVYSFGVSSAGNVYLVMELVEDETLRAKLQRETRLSAAHAVEIARAIADMLVAAHAISLVHRDLKPENVFAGTRVRVVDFGLAFLHGHDATEGGRMTTEGVVAGTPAYLSPEQARGKEVGPATDIYALGCMLFEMLAGIPPFTGGEIDVLTKQLFAPAPSLRDTLADPSRPTALDALIARMLRKAPKERPTADEVRSALAELGEHERSRDGLVGREARMVSSPGGTADVALAELEVAIWGEVSAELLMGLAANGVHGFSGREGGVVYAPSRSTEELAALIADGSIVVTDAEPVDLERLAACVRLGVAEVVSRPVSPDDLSRALHRAARAKTRREAR